MKTFIVATAVLLLLLLVMIQYPAEMRTHLTLSNVQSLANRYKASVRQEGGWTPELIDSFTSEMEKRFGGTISRADIKVLSPVNIPRGGLIKYSVKFKLWGIIGAPSFFGISSDRNFKELSISDMLVSEKIDRTEGGGIGVGQVYGFNPYDPASSPPLKTGIIWRWDSVLGVWIPLRDGD